MTIALIHTGWPNKKARRACRAVLFDKLDTGKMSRVVSRRGEPSGIWDIVSIQ